MASLPSIPSRARAMIRTVPVGHNDPARPDTSGRRGGDRPSVRPGDSVRQDQPGSLVSGAVPAPRTLPDDLTARPLTPDDVDSVAALLEAAEKVDDTGEHLDADDLTEWWVNELVDLRRDGLAVHGPDGGLVGWATALAPPTFRDAFAVYLEGRVHPAHRGRGIGGALLEWQVPRGAGGHAGRHPQGPAPLPVSGPAPEPG